jgi:hypothetical protein
LLGRYFSVALVAVCVNIVHRAQAEIPGAGDLKAPTHRNLVASKAAFFKRTIGQAYQAVGKHDPKWDAGAANFFDAVSAYLANKGYDDDDGGPSVGNLRDDALAAGRPLMDAGCDDPLYLYCQAVLAQDANKTETVRSLLESAITGMIERKYPAYDIMAAAQRMLKTINPATEVAAADKYTKIVWQYAAAALSTKTADEDLRCLLMGIEEFFKAAPAEKQLEWCKALAASKQAHPWLVEYLNGMCEYDAAWEARGHTYADKVTAEGWKGYSEHLASARPHLLKAHELHPDFPEGATAMIGLTMSDSDHARNGTARDWFEKAIKAQFDFIPAYYALEVAMNPRWGGTEDALIAFGTECVGTQRFDTAVPLRLLRIVEQLSFDRSYDYVLYTRPDVQAGLQELLEKYADKSANPKSRNRYESMRIAVAWRAGQYDQAAAVLDKTGGQVYGLAFTEFHSWSSYAIGQIRAMTGPDAEQLKAAEADAKKGDLDSALAIYHPLADKQAKIGATPLFFHFRTRDLEIQKGLASGGWVSLKAGQGFAPWRSNFGEWSFKDGAINVKTERVAGLLLCNADVGDSYEYHAKIVVPDKAKPPSAGLVFGYVSATRRYTVGIDYGRSVIYNGRDEKPMDVKGGETLTVRLRGDKYDVLVNGHLIFSDCPFVHAKIPSKELCVGLMAHAPRAGSGVVKFAEVQIRRLDPAK